MIAKIKAVLLILLTAFVITAPVATSAVVFAAPDINEGLCQGANLEIGSDCDITTIGEQGTDKINALIATVINIFSLVVGVVAVIMIIIGGLKYITSGGDSGNVTGAKNTILYAIIGLVIVALSQFIVKFVLGKATA